MANFRSDSIIVDTYDNLNAQQDQYKRAPSTKKKTTTSTTVKPSSVAPTTITTTTTTNAAPSATAAYGSTPRSDCSCGYFMSGYGNAYYPLFILVDFASVSSIDALSALGIVVSTGRIGGVNQDDHITSCHSDPANVRFTSDGTIQLVVPGTVPCKNSISYSR